MTTRLGTIRPTFPKVVQYRIADGRIFNAPPRDGTPYTLVIHDLAEYERLCGTGDLGPDHLFGGNPERVDNRKVG